MILCLTLWKTHTHTHTLTHSLTHTLTHSHTHTLTLTHTQLYSTTLWFYILFFFVHMITTFIVTVEIYYRWQIDIKQSFIQVYELIKQKIRPKKDAGIEEVQGEGEGEGEAEGVQDIDKINRKSIFDLFEMYRKEGLCPPKHKVALIKNVMFIIIEFSMISRLSLIWMGL